MSITSGLIIAAGGLTNTHRQLALLAHNVSNASTPGYVREVATQTAMTADGTGIGVRFGPAVRDIDLALQHDLWSQSAIVAELEIKKTALFAIDALSGTPGSGEDLSAQLGAIRDAFTHLEENPADQSIQRSVVDAAVNTTTTIHRIAETYQQLRQLANNAIHDDIGSLNDSLKIVGNLSNEIILLKSSGESTADLENLRDSVIRKVSELIQIKVLNQPDGDLQLLSTTGLLLATHAGDPPFNLLDSNIQAGAWYPGGGVPGIMLGGTDVTRQFGIGKIAGNLALRDSILPTFQAALDELSKTLTERFDAQGLTLFTDPSGNVPATGGVPIQSGYIGYSLTIQVSSSVLANSALVRDGTHAVVGSPTGPASFIPNPVGGPSGFTNMIRRVAENVFGQHVQPGVLHTPVNLSGLGADGLLHILSATPETLTDFAISLIATQSSQAASFSDKLESDGAIQSALQARFDQRTGVDVDSEMANMVQLQNTYAANARVIAAVQGMWDQLLGVIR